MSALPAGRDVLTTQSLEIEGDYKNAAQLSGMRPALRAGGRFLVWHRLCQLCPILCLIGGFLHRMVGTDRHVDPGQPILLVDWNQRVPPHRPATLANAAEPGGLAVFLCFLRSR